MSFHPCFLDSTQKEQYMCYQSTTGLAPAWHLRVDPAALDLALEQPIFLGFLISLHMCSRPPQLPLIFVNPPTIAWTRVVVTLVLSRVCPCNLSITQRGLRKDSHRRAMTQGIPKIGHGLRHSTPRNESVYVKRAHGHPVRLVRRYGRARSCRQCVEMISH